MFSKLLKYVPFLMILPLCADDSSSIPKQVQKIEFGRFNPAEATPIQMDRCDAEGVKDGDVGEGKNQLVKLFGYRLGRIGDTFYRPAKGERDYLKFSGEFLFFGEGVGYLPERCDYSPGFRLSLDTLPLYKKIELGARYTHWGREFENTFKIPVMQIERTISNDYDFDAAQFTIGRSLPISSRFTLKPQAGVVWEKYLRETSMKGTWKITERSISLGPLFGCDLHTKLIKTLSLNTHLSAAYLQTSNREWFDKKLTKQQAPYYHPKSQIGLNLEYRPLPSLRLIAGYEIHYDWTKDVHGKIDWNRPSNLQGFKAELAYEF